MYSKSLLKEGSVSKAVEAYQQVLVIDPEFTDTELDGELRQVSAQQYDEPGLHIFGCRVCAVGACAGARAPGSPSAHGRMPPLRRAAPP